MRNQYFFYKFKKYLNLSSINIYAYIKRLLFNTYIKKYTLYFFIIFLYICIFYLIFSIFYAIQPWIHVMYEEFNHETNYIHNTHNSIEGLAFILKDEDMSIVNNIFYQLNNKGNKSNSHRDILVQGRLTLKQYITIIRESEDILYANGLVYPKHVEFKEPTLEEIRIVTTGSVGKTLFPYKEPRYLTQAEIYLRLQNTPLKRFLRSLNLYQYLKTLIWIYNPLDWEGWFWIIISFTLVGATVALGYFNIFIEESTNAFPEPHIKTEEERKEEVYYEVCKQIGETGQVEPILYAEFRELFIPPNPGDPDNIPIEHPITVIEVPEDLYEEIKQHIWPKPPKKVRFNKVVDIFGYDPMAPVRIHGLEAKELRLSLKDDCKIQ